MSDDKKYYYLKLKDGFFNEDAAVALESMENGFIYSNIRFKLYLKSLKFNGKLMMTDRIPYDIKNVDTLAKVIRCDIDNLRVAIKIFKELDIIEILDNGEMYMLDIQNYIGHSSTEADRKREYRLHIDTKKQIEDKCPDKSKDKNPPELESELKKEKEINIYKNILEYWNSKQIHVHKNGYITKIKGKINTILKDYKIDDITQAIDRFAEILKDDKYYWSHAWELVDFLGRGFEKFNSDIAYENYIDKEYDKNDTSKIKSEIEAMKRQARKEARIE